MKRMQTIAACIAMAFFLAACGGTDEASEGNGDPAQNGGGGASGNGGSASDAQYAEGEYAFIEDGAADDQYEEISEGDLPFPIPPDAEVVASGQESGERAFNVAMNVPSGEDAYEFYLEALPEEDFEILRDSQAVERPPNSEGGNGEGESFSASLLVEGNDLRGKVLIDERRATIRMSEAAAEAAAAAREQFEEDMEAFQQELEEFEGMEQQPEGEAPEGEAPEE